MRRNVIGSVVLLLVLALQAMAAGDDSPSWLLQAANLKCPEYDKDVTAVVLVDDGAYTVGEDGRVTKVYNYAVRILQRSGRDYAVGRVGYIPDVGKVKDLKAWLIRANGDVKRYGKDETLDVAGAMNDVYNEYRYKAISAVDDADAGMVFGYSYTTEDRSVFSQDEWSFQSDIPVIASRYTLTLPSGWRAESVTFNHSPIEATVSGSTYSWQLANLPPLSDEPMSPSNSNLVPRIAVSYYPPTGTQVTSIRTFANWSDVGSWMSELEDPQVTVDESLANKAKELTSAARTEYEKILAIGRYVQKVQYISIQTGLGRGGGYRPHLATEVFAKSYGDCKDKANLMRAMLKVVGIDSYPVSIYSGDPEYVKPNWPSPQQFNHCIIAVKVGNETQAATIIQHPRFGRLLIFDPTSTETPVGDLPYYLQGSLALINSRESDALVAMPVTPPEMNSLERQTDLRLGVDGSIIGTIKEKSQGQVAARFRGEFRSLSRQDYNSKIEHWLTAGATAARLAKAEPTDLESEGRFLLDIEFTAPAYGQLMQDRLLVFKPAVVARRESLSLTAGERKYPIVLRSNSYTETVRIKLPTGFDVDELPDPVKLRTSFGAYETSYEIKGDELIFNRKLDQRSATISPDQYQSVRGFFEKIRLAEQSPVVLVRK